MRLLAEDDILQYAKRTVWFATGNSDKFREATSILRPWGIKLAHLKRTKVEIQDLRLENIAKFALDRALQHLRGAVLVEDSGLFVDSLGGFPGPYSSFVYSTIGLKGILSLMRGKRLRQAHFQSTVVYGSPSTQPRVFSGRVTGNISKSILGSNGFGYDPIFIPKGHSETFGQSSELVKNSKSHRARSFEKFARWFVGQPTRDVGTRLGKRVLK